GPLAVAPQLIVQVRAGRGAGRADIGDHLALADALAGPQAAGEPRQVSIAGLPAAGVTDADPVAIAAPATGLDDHAVGGGEHRGAARRGEVGALVHAAIAGNRVAADAVVGADPRAVDRRAQQEAPDILALGVEVLGLRRAF